MDESLVRQLVSRVLDSGCTPEDACEDTPHLLAEVREQLQRIRALDEKVDGLFPDEEPGEEPRHSLEELPRVPGHEVLSVLGHGGMGVVYRARHLRLKRTVAVKMLLRGAHTDGAGLKRLLREAEAVAALHHPNIVQVHEVGDHEGLPYFTMELVEGGSLSQRLAGAPQPAAAAAELVSTLARAMDVAHREGIVHRDLKPANVLVAPDGTAKIVDFGLARRMEGGESLTGSGTILGTPGYMAPEQIRGTAVGPAADVYALGAILYEMLTGRPPFHCETPIATQLQVLTNDAVRPSLLNSRVPRDLETICLACLRKEAGARYPSAAALADDLDRFRRGEPIVARPASVVERGLKWIRRRPATATLLAVGVLGLVALSAGSLWLVSVRASTTRGAEEDLQQVAAAHRRSDWAAGSAALERAQLRLGSSPGFGDLRERVERARREAELARRVDAIDRKRIAWHDAADFLRIDGEYAQAFRDAQLIEGDEAPEIVAPRMARTDIPQVIVNALDDWIFCTGSDAKKAWLLAVAELAFPDPSHWRERVADPRTWEDGAKIAELALDVPVESASLAGMIAFADRLFARGDPNAVPFLLRVLDARPGEYIVFVYLGRVMAQRQDYAEALRYYQAADVVRPDTHAVHEGRAWVLEACGRYEEATDEWREVVRIDPRWQTYVNLSAPLVGAGRHQEACDALEQSLRLLPEDADARGAADVRTRLGDVLLDLDRRDEAVVKLREALALCEPLELDDVFKQARNEWFEAMARGETWDEGIVELQENLLGRPDSIQSWFGYAELCAFLGRTDDYRDARLDLLARFGASADPQVCESIGRACLLLPASGDELERSRAMIERAIASARDWRLPYFLLARALAEYRAGRAEAALSIVRDGAVAQALFPAPKLVEALALARIGRSAEARHALAQAVTAVDWGSRSVDWSQRAASNREMWIFHVLRREAESAILPEAEAFLRDERVPEDDDERLALTALCEDRGFHRMGASLWADVIASRPALLAEHGYEAAAAAALAGCGIGADAQELGAAERADLREQSVQWLNRQLDACEQKLARKRQDDVISVNDTLREWRTSWKLAGLRDPDRLAQLPADERESCEQLWQRLEGLLGRRDP